MEIVVHQPVKQKYVVIEKRLEQSSVMNDVFVTMAPHVLIIHGFVLVNVKHVLQKLVLLIVHTDCVVIDIKTIIDQIIYQVIVMMNNVILESFVQMVFHVLMMSHYVHDRVR